MSSATTIRTPRLLLRAVVSTDIEALHQIYTNEDVMRYEGRPPHASMDQTAYWIAKIMDNPANGTREFCFAKLDVPDVLIGKVGLWGEAVSPEMEIGVMLNRNEWGKGYAREALAAFLEYYWALDGAKSLVALKADVDPRNAASMKLLKGAGFKEVGFAERTYNTHIGWCDSVYLELRRAELS